MLLMGSDSCVCYVLRNLNNPNGQKCPALAMNMKYLIYLPFDTKDCSMIIKKTSMKRNSFLFFWALHNLLQPSALPCMPPPCVGQ